VGKAFRWRFQAFSQWLRAVVGGEGVLRAAPIDLGGSRVVVGGEGVSMVVPGVFAVVEGRCRW